MALQIKPTPTLTGEEAKAFAEKFRALTAAQNPQHEKMETKERLEKSLEFLANPGRILQNP